MKIHVLPKDDDPPRYTVKIGEQAEEWLRKYPHEIQERFANRIRKLNNNPESHGKPLRGPLHGTWEMYFENKFRITYTIDEKKKLVEVTAIKHKDEF